MNENENGIGVTIMNLRTGAKLTRQELCDKAGISYNTLKAIEYGKNGASYTIVEKILDALGYEIILLKNKK